MVKIGNEMLQKCGGLPLAIVVLGGLLSKKSAQEWRLVRDYIWLHLNRDSDNQISYILSLSFNDLPYQLKVCFLYLGHFPEDYEIPVSKQIQLWVAEGFIPQNEEIMEDVAYYYLNELIRRSLIQKDKMRRERTLTCRVHDLLRNLAIEKAEELNLFHIYGVNKGSTYYSRTRRLAVYSGTESNLQLQQSKVLRSLLFVRINNANAREGLLSVWSSFRLLRVLNLSHLWLGTIPKELGKLIHLKYLGIKGYITTVFLSLVSLQTLNCFDSTFFPCRPTEICKLQELRHLFGKFIGDYRIDNMKNLPTLKSISVETLVNLRELHIKSYLEKENEFTFDSIAKLKALQILRVEFPSCIIRSLQPLSNCEDLVELTLSVVLEKLPEEMPAYLPNLECLELTNCKLNDDPMPTLEKLPNLRVLNFAEESYCFRKLVCSKGGFPRLEILVILGKYFEELQVAEGAMPELRSFLGTYLIIPERLKKLPLPAEWEYGDAY